MPDAGITLTVLEENVCWRNGDDFMDGPVLTIRSDRGFDGRFALACVASNPPSPPRNTARTSRIIVISRR